MSRGGFRNDSGRTQNDSERLGTIEYYSERFGTIVGGFETKRDVSEKVGGNRSSPPPTLPVVMFVVAVVDVAVVAVVVVAVVVDSVGVVDAAVVVAVDVVAIDVALGIVAGKLLVPFQLIASKAWWMKRVVL